MNRSGAATGALVGALLTAPLIALFYLGQSLLGLPFPPFSLFDRVARELPGVVVTGGIDAMVAAIRGLGLGPTSAVAKTTEQAMAVALFATVCVAAVALFFVVLRLRPAWRGSVAGLVLGAAVGAPLAWVTAGAQVGGADPIATTTWVVGLTLAWGFANASVHARLARPAAPPVAMPPTGGGAPDPRPPSPGQRGDAAGPEPPVWRERDCHAAASRVKRLDRRTFLVRVGGATAVLTLAGVAIGRRLGGGVGGEAGVGDRWSSSHPLPNADDPLEPARGTRPELTPLEDHYRIDINTQPPEIRESDWALRLGGLVERPGEWTLDELRGGFEPTHQFVTLACISNPIAGDLTSTTRWTGVPLRGLIDRVRPTAEASHLKITAADGFHEVVPLDAVRDDARVMLTYAWDGAPLPVRHGFPLRIYIPDRYGMKQPKWIETIEAVDGWEAGYWVERGWDRKARMHATSVVDSVAVDMMVAAADEDMRIPIGGIAHAGARGISRVEVRVDDGPWEAARLRRPLSETTWVVWRYDWPFRAGRHTFTVRCFEGDGTPQVAERSPVRPSGATGLHSVDSML